MSKKIRRWLGIEKRSPYVDLYFDMANFRSSIYMSVVVLVLELWMIISLAQRWFSGDSSRTVAWYIRHLVDYGVFFLTAACMLFSAVLTLRGKIKKTLPGKIVMWFFSGVALYFGVSISYSDYAKGEQILCFIMMIIFVMGLLNWRPIVSILLSSSVFLYFYHLMVILSTKPITYATQVNFFTLWVSIVMLALAVYGQRLSEAEKSERLEKSSKEDDLTGIPNMSYFREKAPKLLARDGIEDKLFLFLDLVNFKSYNEKYGFDAGSDFICETANMVKNYFAGDLYARYSDDHFVVLTDRANIEDRIKNLTQEIRGKHDSTQISLKAGSYAPRSVKEDPSIACDHARYACNTIKKYSDCNYTEYDAMMDEGFQKKQYIITHVEDAVKNGYIQVYYQPVVWAKDRSLCGLEALARWLDPNYGFLSPGDFIPALEEYRLIHFLDQAVLTQVCLDLQASMQAGSRVLPVSINFSRLDFELFDVNQFLQETLLEYGVPKNLIHAEITESALSAKGSKLRNSASQIKTSGVELWLDDFGSGYSSLNVLKDYNFDVMKIDMVFLQDFGKNEKSKAILNSIVTMAKLIDMETLTEGVEDEEQAEFLTEIGCQRLQGYLFGKPMPLSQIQNEYHCF
ncbi:MAG: EAL domain-containing protein [Eubacterium sp.]|nr:EAL domain-containing protein [Eubacterium sp.]